MFQQHFSPALQLQPCTLQYPLISPQNIHPLPIIKSSTILMTSLDGRPFLTPEQFGSLLVKEHQRTCDKAVVALSTRNKFKYNAMLNKNALLLMQNKLGYQSGIGKRMSSFFDKYLDMDCHSLYKKLKTESGALAKIAFSKDFKGPNPLSIKGYKNELLTYNQENPTKIICKTIHSTQPPNKFVNQSSVKKIYGVHYDSAQQDLIFKVELEPHHLTGVTQEAQMSRKDLIEKDPLLLLYFYEDQLQFNNNPNFNSDTLIKI